MNVRGSVEERWLHSRRVPFLFPACPRSRSTKRDIVDLRIAENPIIEPLGESIRHGRAAEVAHYRKRRLISG